MTESFNIVHGGPPRRVWLRTAGSTKPRRAPVAKKKLPGHVKLANVMVPTKPSHMGVWVSPAPPPPKKRG